LQRDAGQAAAQGAAQQVNQVGSQIVQRSINVQPTLEIRPGQRVGVMVNKDLALTPYAP
jgi:type IV secretory pathway VirB10-like protein